MHDGEPVHETSDPVLAHMHFLVDGNGRTLLAVTDETRVELTPGIWWVEADAQQPPT